MLYLGAADPRRDPLLAGLGRSLWARECQLLIPPLEPRTRPRPDFLKGDEKYRRLRSAQVLLNLHRTTSSALEWMRFLEAICNGCVVVSEPCLDNDPLVPDEHFLAASVDSIADVVDGLLDEPERLRQLRRRAYDFVRQELPMSLAAYSLAEFAAQLPRQPPARASSPLSVDSLPAHPPMAEPQPGESPVQGKKPVDEAPPGRKPHPVGTNTRVSSIKTSESHRWLRSVLHRVVGKRHESGLRILAETATYAGSTPRVTVVSVVTHNLEREGVEALASAAASHYSEFEVLILDDGSSDGDSPAVRRFLDDHPSLPAILLRQPVNRGLAHARNTLAERARGEYVFVLDANGGIYPSTLGRLVRMLDAEPQAVFSYPMVAAFDGHQRAQLLSSLPWEPQRLRNGNWIDGMALIRRGRLLKLGGYSTDPRLAGWEDFYLWCRCAEAGAHGVHVPQVLAWHRPTADSKTPAKWALMREIFPELLALPNGV